MQKYTYHFELKDILTQFLQAFDGAVVRRYDTSRAYSNSIAVRYVYAPKQRVLHDLVNKAQHITLPAVSFWINSISRDPTRVFNKIEGQYWKDNSSSVHAIDTVNKYLQPVPVNIDVSVSILTRFQSDMDQIISNFVPYNDPYFIISWTRQDMSNLEIRSEVLWSGNLAMTYPVEQDSSQPTRVICDTTFTIKGWLFKADSDPVGRIFKVDSNFYAVSGTPTLQNIVWLEQGAPTETFVLSAVPQIVYSSRWLTNRGASGTVELFGDMYTHTTNVYLSANNAMFGTTTIYNPFSASPGLSAAYSAVTGISALSYSVVSDNKMFVSYPAPSAVGYFDIIVVNDAGYNKLSTGSYNTHYSTQFPFVSGIQVV